MTTYKKIEKILTSQGKFCISLELTRIKAILKALDNPQEKLKIIHVAGTNGKGSTCAMLCSILSKQGYKTGLYTSPHLIKYNERISISGILIDDETFFELINKIEEISHKNKINLTEFELLTAVMYKYFYDQHVDFAIVEVGLGGRFDATNCIDKPLISVITSISKDHTERLGNTIDKIAFEKAGIIKQGVPVICDENNKGFKLIKKIAQEKKSTVEVPQKSELTIKNNTNEIIYNNKKYKLNLLGNYQGKNASLVLKTVEVLKKMNVKVSEKSIREGLASVQWKGRFQYIKDKNILLDGCHNPDGARSLKESLDRYFPEYKRTYIYTSLINKEYKKIQELLFRKEDLVFHFNNKSGRFLSKADIKNCTKSIDIEQLKQIIKERETEILNDAKRKDLLIICGSLYAMGDILGKIELCS